MVIPEKCLTHFPACSKNSVNVAPRDCVRDIARGSRGADRLQAKRIIKHINQTNATREVHSGLGGSAHGEGFDLSLEK